MFTIFANEDIPKRSFFWENLSDWTNLWIQICPKKNVLSHTRLVYGTLHKRNDFSTVQMVFSIAPKPILHLNLPLYWTRSAFYILKKIIMYDL